MVGEGEKGKEPDDDEEYHRDDVDPHAMPAQAPSGGGERLFSDAFDDETGEGNDVGGEEGGNA